MRTENDKAFEELNIFSKFVRLSDLPISKVEKRYPPEPDILCCIASEAVAFELAEACVPEVAQAISAIARAGSHEPVWGADTVEETVRRKIQKQYPATQPIELLVYTDGRIAPSDDVLLSQIRFALGNGLGPFRRVWFMGGSAVVPV